MSDIIKSPVEISSIPDTFRRVASKYADKPAVVYLGTAYSYKRLDELSDRFASGLKKLGVSPGGRVVLYLPNSIQWLVAWLGSLKAGAVAVPITPIYTPDDLDYIANDTGAEAIVCADRNYGYVARVLDKTDIKAVIACGMVELLPAYKRAFGWIFDKVPHGKVAKNPNTFRLRDFLQFGDAQTVSVESDPDDMAEILYTGGTTRHPKGVPISHRLVLQCAHEQISTSAALFPLNENVVQGSAPMFHILGQTTALGTVLLHGGTILLQPRANLDAMLDAAMRWKAGTFIGVPALYRMILEHDRLDQYDLSSLKYCFTGGDVMPVEVQERWQQVLKKDVYVGYGATETVGGVAMTPPLVEPAPGSMGNVLASKEIRIIDPLEMEEVPIGEPGELLVHSDPMVTSYWNKPEETDASFVELDGKIFYRTSDIVRTDGSGRLFFVDRTIDTIKHKGYRVSASEIESVLQDHPAVISSCAIGIPDETVGQRIKAFVVLKKDVKGVTGYELISFCRQRLAGYKVPQYIEFRDMLPMSKVGKLLRREVRDEEKSRLK